MNTQVQELKDVLINNNVTSINNGVLVLNDFFKQFEFHILKSEWSSMNRDEKRKFVKTLLNTENNDDDLAEIESHIDDETAENPDENREYDVTNENPINDTEIDLAINNDEISNEKTEVQILLEQEVNELIQQREELSQKLQTINDRLSELGHNQNVDSSSKTEQCKQWIKQNPNCKRADFMKHFEQLGSKALLSTYWQKLKP